MSTNQIKITLRNVTELLPSARNSRVHSDEQVEQIVKSIEEFGFIKPIYIDAQDEIIAGHGSVKAAKKLGMKQVPVVVLKHLTETQKRALLIADNKIPMNAAWDVHMLQIELKELKAEGFDMELLAFSDGELSDIFGEDSAGGNTADDHTPGVVKGKPTSKLQDVWLMGEHRVMCGSCTVAADFKKLMNGDLASLVFTDPPYGISYESEEFDEIEGDDLRRDNLCKDLLIPALKLSAKYARDNAAFYIWHGHQTREDFAHALKIAGLQELQYLIWAKPGMVLGNQDYRNTYEPCFYAAKAGEKPRFLGGRDEPNVWRVTFSDDREQATTLGKGILISDGDGGKLFIKGAEPKAGKLRNVRLAVKQSFVLYSEERNGTLWQVSKDAGRYVHPTQKPVELALRAITNSSTQSELVLDPFLGSGSTLIAAEKLKRRCYGTDLDPRYVDVIVQRWQEFSGRPATLEGTKKTFDQIASERRRK
jgi:DNA modification methylase